MVHVNNSVLRLDCPATPFYSILHATCDVFSPLFYQVGCLFLRFIWHISTFVLECPWIFAMDLDLMLILWPLDSWNGLFLPISYDHDLVFFITLNCNWSSGMFGIPLDWLLLEMGLPGIVSSMFQGCIFFIFVL